MNNLTCLEGLKPFWIKPSRLKVLYGGRGSGKSYSAATHVMMASREVRLNILCLRQLQNSIRQSIYTLIKDLIFQAGIQNEFQFTIADITTVGSLDTIVLSQELTAGTSDIETLYYGWKVPIRVGLGESASGKVKFTIPSKKHANLIKGDTETAQNYYSNLSNAKPHGRWIKVRLNFEGLDQVYIESVVSENTLRYS